MRPYLTVEMCANIIADPIHREEQPDGRIRFWGFALVPGEDTPRVLRVVTLADGQTIHTAFIDSGFSRGIAS